MERNYTHTRDEKKTSSRQLAQDPGPDSNLIIYLFLTSWYFVYESNVFLS